MELFCVCRLFFVFYFFGFRCCSFNIFTTNFEDKLACEKWTFHFEKSKWQMLIGYIYMKWQEKNTRKKKKEQNTNNQKYARNKQWWKCYENILWLIPFEEQSEGVEIVVNSVFRLVVVVYSCCLSSFATAPIPFLLSVCVFQCQHISLPLSHSLVLLSMIINEAHNLRQSYHTFWSPYSITFACNTSQFSRFMHIRRKYCQVIGVTVDDWTIKRI